MTLYIKNMVSPHSILMVEEELKRLELDYVQVKSGEIELREDISKSAIDLIKDFLGKNELELIEDKKTQLIEKIKNSIIEMIRDTDKPLKINFSNYLSSLLMYDYTYMANLFSKIQGITIEHYIIHHKIEHVKELLANSQLTVKEISYKLHYSSVSHLSNQFKKVTGFTLKHFKQLGNKQLLFL